MLIGDILARNARIHPHRAALVMEGQEVTYAGMAARVRRHAAFLRSLGLGRGDRVAILAHSTPLYIEMLFAVTGIGGTLVPLNRLLVPREIEAILHNADPKALLFEAESRDVVEAIRPSLPAIARFASVDRKLAGYPFAGDAAERPETGAPPAAEDDIALLIYAGRMTGRPKGAMLSHRNLVSAAASAAIELSLTRNDVYLSCTPLPFIAGTGRLIRFLLVGATIVLQPEFDPAEALAAIERKRITHVLFTPAMIARILDLPDAGRYDLSTLKLVMYGGAFIPLDLLKRAIGFFGGRLAQTYGHVESAGLLTFLHPEDHSLDESAPSLRKLMSVGKEAIGVEVRVVDDAGRPVPSSQVGELIARGPNVFAGYFRDPALTAETIRAGWLCTGDVASVDEEGYISVVDRKRDTLMTAGIQVSPKEIENVIAEHPAVREVAVVPRPDYALGEVPVAIVALREGAHADAEEILAHCRRNMAPFKVPESVEFLAALPRNSQGKVLKARLREQAAGRGKPFSPPRTPRR